MDQVAGQRCKILRLENRASVRLSGLSQMYLAGSLRVEGKRGELAGKVEWKALGNENHLPARGDDHRAFIGRVDLLSGRRSRV